MEGRREKEEEEVVDEIEKGEIGGRRRGKDRFSD